jgi:hypothetical protein
MIVVGWLSPVIYGQQVTPVRAMCAMIALAGAEAVVSDDWTPVEREFLTLALGLVISFGFAMVIQLFWPRAV